MIDLIHFGIYIAGIIAIIIISYLMAGFLSKRSFLTGIISGQENLHWLLGLLIVMALGDFYFVSFIPVAVRITDPVTRQGVLGIFAILSIIAILITIEIRKVVLDIQISLIDRNMQFLQYSITLIIMQEIVVALFYLGSMIGSGLGAEVLPGVTFIFDVQATEIADLSLITDPVTLISVLLLASIKGTFLVLHHGSIIIVFMTLFVIFQEWNSRTHETPINFFVFFTLGFVIQGLGQIMQTGGSILAAFYTGDLPYFISLPITLGVFIHLIGAITYYIFFILASVSLLNNISHMLLPKILAFFCKILVIILPAVYGILYTLIFLLNGLWFIGFGGEDFYNLAEYLVELTHLLDIPAMIILPFSCGLFFLVAYRQGKEKEKGRQLSSFVLWSFLALFLIFGTGNNTMSTVSWFGMLHGPLSLLGAITLLYGMSRVADHASRHRRVIKYIRDNPEDFTFLTKLGEAERKIQCWVKVDSLVKTGVIKPLVPVEKPDETKVAAEINSYMAEIARTRKRVRKRRPVTG
ncbi:MAG: hypothetical protein ACTSP4_13860 [Candidatus Hodarchaeales archaeon]